MLGYGLASAVLALLSCTVSGGGITSKLQVHVSVFVAETTRSSIVVVVLRRAIRKRTPTTFWVWFGWVAPMSFEFPGETAVSIHSSFLVTSPCCIYRSQTPLPRLVDMTIARPCSVSPRTVVASNRVFITPALTFATPTSTLAVVTPHVGMTQLGKWLHGHHRTSSWWIVVVARS